MPKCVTYCNRILTNTSRNLKIYRYHVFYCKKCQAHILITDINLGEMPKRRTDGALVIDSSKWMVRVSTKVSETPVKIPRAKGIETQYRHACETCGEVIGYQSVPDALPRPPTELEKNKAVDKPREKEPAIDAAATDVMRELQKYEFLNQTPAADAQQSPLCSGESSSTSPHVANSTAIAPEDPNNSARTPAMAPATRVLLYLNAEKILLPRYKLNSPWYCKVCGYVTKSANHLELHIQQKGHENQAEGTFAAQKSGATEQFGDPDEDPGPPVIVG